MRSVLDIENDLDFYQDAHEKAEQHTQDIFDVVSSVGQVDYLHKSYEYTTAIENKIKSLKVELEEVERWEAENED